MKGRVWLTLADHSEAELCALEELQVLESTGEAVTDDAIVERVAASGFDRERAERAVRWLYEQGYRTAEKNVTVT